MADVLVAPDAAQTSSRVVQRRRSLPGTRAVVGALLVVAAAVGTFAAYLTSTAAPTTGFLTAARPVAQGQVLSAADLAVTFVDLDVAQASTVLRDSQLGEVVGTIATAPMAPGAFVLGSMVQPVTALDGELFSFSLPADRALGGTLQGPLDVDLIATYGSGETASTVYLVRGVRVTSTSATEGSLGGGSMVITVLLPDTRTVLRVAHAIGNAAVWVVRPGAGDAVPPPYTFDGR